MDKALGRRLQVAGFAVSGNLENFEAQAFLQEIVQLIGMTPHGEAVVRMFPTIEGLGGEGETIVQPFFLQPLVESFTFCLPGAVAFDSYKLEKGNGFYLLIASCKEFDPLIIENHIVLRQLKILDIDSMILKLER